MRLVRFLSGFFKFSFSFITGTSFGQVCRSESLFSGEGFYGNLNLLTAIITILYFLSTIDTDIKTFVSTIA